MLFRPLSPKNSYDFDYIFDVHLIFIIKSCSYLNHVWEIPWLHFFFTTFMFSKVWTAFLPLLLRIHSSFHHSSASFLSGILVCSVTLNTVFASSRRHLVWSTWNWHPGVHVCNIWGVLFCVTSPVVLCHPSSFRVYFLVLLGPERVIFLERCCISKYVFFLSSFTFYW